MLAAILAAMMLASIASTSFAGEAPPVADPDSALSPADSAKTWSYTDRAYRDREGRRPIDPVSLSQKYLAHFALCAGFADPGQRDVVVTIDTPRRAPVLRWAIVERDTFNVREIEACGSVPRDPLRRTYISIVRWGGVVAPDSVRVALADGSSFLVPYSRRVK